MNNLYGESMKEMSKDNITELYGAEGYDPNWNPTPIIPTTPKCAAISLITVGISAISGFVSKAKKCI